MMSILIKKSLLVFFVFVNLFALTIPSAEALFFGGKSISISDIAGQIEARYHLNLESMQNSGEQFNVSHHKANPPEVRLFFSPADPKPGYEITAKAFPQFFANNSESLYYTWYLRRSECDKEDPIDEDPDYCDADDDNDVDEEDWKIEAMRHIANNGFDTNTADYESSDSDSDEYLAAFGGDNGVKAATLSDTWIDSNDNSDAYCYIHDWGDGLNYELSSSSQITFSCPSGTTEACVDESDLVCSSSTPDNAFDEYSICADTGLKPSCISQDTVSAGRVHCDIGKPRCVSTINEYTCSSVSGDVPCTSYGSPLTSCSTTQLSSRSNLCEHLFPNADGRTPDGKRINEISGDGEYNEDEENFWTTDPTDPDTADTQQGDEANVVGFGLDSFTWNYQNGDKVGVVIEGISVIPTKHEDNSSMIMWALPNNICPVINKGEYTKQIKGYGVDIPTADMEINDCLEANLVDPREGGQPGNIDVSLRYTPDFPKNDPEDNEFGTIGDRLTLSSSVDSSTNSSAHVIYDWNIEISSDGTYSPRRNNENDDDATSDGGWVNITKDLQDAELMGQSIGNSLSSLPIKLNITDDVLGNFLSLSEVFSGGTGYLRIKLDVSEYYDFDNVSRKGHSEIIVKIISSNNRIQPYKPTVLISGTEDARVSIGSDSRIICEEDNELIRKNVCFITKNEIVGVSTSTNLENHAWQLNGKPLVCNSSISPDCSDTEQTNYAFFPVTGDTNEIYTVTVSASDVETGELFELSRVFRIVDPYVELLPISADGAEQQTIFKKHIGTYIDEKGVEFSDKSANNFQAFHSNVVGIKAVFHPGFTLYDSKMQWSFDGALMPIDTSLRDEFWFSVDKTPGNYYSVMLEALYYQHPDTRRALKDIWDISGYTAGEVYLEEGVSIEVVGSLEYEEYAFTGPRALFASLATNIPSHILFSLQLVLLLIVTIGTIGFIYSLYPTNRR